MSDEPGVQPMWKKEDEQTDKPGSETTPRRERAATRTGSIEGAVIGPSISIQGEVTGDEDLLIQGRVNGSVDLKQHELRVGADGEVKADITARVITVEGKVEGDLTADEQVVLRSSAVVDGDITARRVVLEDGARFRGGVDMGERSEKVGRTGGLTSSQSRKRPESSTASEKDGGSSSEKEKSSTDSAAETAK